MSRIKLIVYNSLEEFNQYYEKYKSHEPLFIFNDNDQKLLNDEYRDPVIIDMTNLIKHLKKTQEDLYLVELRLSKLNEDDIVMVDAEYSLTVLKMFRPIFDNELIYINDDFDVEDNNCESDLDDIIDEVSNNDEEIIEETIYAYNEIHLDELLNDENLNVYNVPELLNEADLKDKNPESIYIDLTSAILASDKDDILLFNIENILSKNKKYKKIINENYVDLALDKFKLYFRKSEDIKTHIAHLSDINIQSSKNEEDLNITAKKIIDLNNEEMKSFFKSINEELFGHQRFKDFFKQEIKNYIKFNKIGDKIFSILILGPSGIGKTEVGRIIQKSLNHDKSLSKINFGNYSSQDSLNSLIGSPRGYKDSEIGELVKKINANKTGVILFDEFEKTTESIRNFFLELLEEGKFTDSMGREYDLNGYILIFTSNMTEKEYNSMPPELKSRFNKVFKFKMLNFNEKQEYAKNNAKNLLNSMYGKKVITIEKTKIENMVDQIFNEKVIKAINSKDNLREINRLVKNYVIEFIDQNKY
nr:AAA family ATPase [Methanobrevibacter arboriphilus]